jgi:hypothetical protein
MKKKFKIFTPLIALMTIPFFVMQCDGSKEKTVEKEATAQTETANNKKVKPQPSALLPKKLLNLGLTEEQIAKCEAAYNEIFTPEVMAQQEEISKKLKSLDIKSEEYKKTEKEAAEKSRQYNDQFNKKLKTILTREQQNAYFGKKAKETVNKPVKPVQSGAQQVKKNESPDQQYEVIDTPFGKVKRPIKKENQ